MPALNAQPNGGRALLEEACARGVPLEVRVDSESRSRSVKLLILDLDDRTLFIENPEHGLNPVHLPSDGVLECFLHLHGTRYGFQSLVTQPRLLVELSGGRKAIAMGIERPAKVVQRQRRNFFRLSLLSGEPIQALMHAAVPEDDGICRLDERRFHGELMNLSIGGAGIRLDLDDARALRISDRIFVSFDLPWRKSHDAFMFLAEVRQSNVLAERNEARLGICFVEWPDKRTFENAQQLLQRFITQVQRDRLRRAS